MKSISIINFTTVDYGLFGIVIISIIISIFRGLIKEVLSIVVWVLAFFIAIKFYNDFTKYLVGFNVNETLRGFIAFAILFIGTLILGAVVNYIVSILVKSTGLTGTDRVLGVFFGAARGVLIAASVILVINYTEFAKNQTFENSFLNNKLQPIVYWLDDFIPENVKQKVNDGKQLKKT